jgi:hypothetical protein
MGWSGEEKAGLVVGLGFIAFWVGSVLVSLGVTGVLIWALVRFVLKFT